MSIQSTINQALSELAYLKLSSDRNKALESIAGHIGEPPTETQEGKAASEAETQSVAETPASSYTSAPDIGADYAEMIGNVARARVELRRNELTRHDKAVQRRIESAKRARDRRAERRAGGD